MDFLFTERSIPENQTTRSGPIQVNPQDEHVAAMQPGAMSLLELTHFLERGAGSVRAKNQTPADVALARGDTLRGPHPEDAAKAYEESLRLAPETWPLRGLAEAFLVGALQDSSQWEKCAGTSAAVVLPGHPVRADGHGYYKSRQRP